MTLREAVAKVRGGAALPTLIIVIFVVHLPFLILHLVSLWQQPHYQYFPVVIGAVCLLVYSRWTNVSDSRNASNSTSSPVFFTAISASLLLLLGAVYLVSPWLSAVSAVVFAGALAMLTAWHVAAYA